ncbi:MAG: DNA polymerase III subunit alpha, partial [Bacteroidota bacterium]|nr:DNA polymerase III subunit alpha [Bacteroidota bacterium]
MFTHLHCHSYYSFSSGTIPAGKLPLLALEHDMTAVALTDTNNMTGAVEFYVAAKKAGIKPIIGVELSNRDERIVLLAKNNDGYREICETVTAVLDAIPQIKPKVTFDSIMKDRMADVAPISSSSSLLPFVEELSHNIIIISSSPIILERMSAIRHHDLYLELIPAQRGNWGALRDLCRSHKLPIVATNNVVLGAKDEYPTHKVLRAIGLNTNIGLLGKRDLADISQYFASENEMRAMLSGVSEEAFANSAKIANECNVDFNFDKPKFARFSCDDPRQLLRALSQDGFWKRYPHPSVAHIQRFSHELETIDTLGATSYYLAVHDMIRFAKRKNFPYLGRGSGANSLIAYCLDISNVDPIENNLRFERFLNPERLMPPDFDIDFSWKDRYEVINYMLDSYGRTNSAMLCTIQTYKSRGAVREIGKALGYPESEINSVYSRLSAMRYSDDSDSIDPTVLHKTELKDVTTWLTFAHLVSGFPNHLSVHAGGVILADKAIVNYAPVQMAPIGVPIMQQDMFTADHWKLIKLDILATRGLGTYWDTMNLVEQRTGKRPPVEDVNVALNDKRTKQIIRTGKTKGIFYVESPAMISLLKKLQCDTFQMLTAASSVIRPGVAQSGMMQEFIARHHDRSRIHYLHPKMEELLWETYGIMIYQEDVLNVVHDLAGLSYGQADLFRRAMSGKLRSQESMKSQKDDFINGCIKQKIAVDTAEELWRQISSFSGYSFCKAHSASYAVLSFQEAWLKVHYPTEFLCSVLNNYGGFYSHQEYINEAKYLAIEVLLPDVNRSASEHTVEQDHVIRLGLAAVREVSETSKLSLINNRSETGRYTGIEDFATRSGVTPDDGRILIA